ncbi:MAG TPA: hypothetical protein VF676_12070 [Flavobacterium sp.]|jgi:hypothetical protein
MEVSIGIYALLFIFFFLVIPGFIARRFYFNGEFSKQVTIGSTTFSNFLSSLFVGIVLSLAFVSLFNFFSDRGIDIDSVLNNFDTKFVSATDAPASVTKFSGLSDNIYKVYLPIIGGIYFFSAIWGFFLSKLVLFFGWDTKWKFLRYNNSWHYLFSGKILKFKRYVSSDIDHRLKVKYTYLDVLVAEKGDETTLYSGLFADYDVSCQDINKLERLHLLKATRYKRNDDKSVTVKNIPGNLFTIMGDRILNINSTYICFDEEENRNKRFVNAKMILLPTQIVSLLFFLTVLVSFLFSLNIVRTSWYQHLLNQSFAFKFIVIFSLNVFVGMITPFTIVNKERKVKFIGAKSFFLKVVVLLICLGALWIVYYNF